MIRPSRPLGSAHPSYYRSAQFAEGLHDEVVRRLRHYRCGRERRGTPRLDAGDLSSGSIGDFKGEKVAGPNARHEMPSGRATLFTNPGLATWGEFGSLKYSITCCVHEDPLPAGPDTIAQTATVVQATLAWSS